jgi:hypothetical protein
MAQNPSAMNDGLLNYVVGALAKRKGHWRAIGVASGVPYDTLSKIARGATPDPGVLTVERLAKHLRQRDDEEQLAA